MKTILCYGDSLTWGSDPETGGRHAGENRWPNVLAAALGAKAEVIVDGLRGRTTAFDEHLADCDRNGARILPTVLYTHAPLDLVTLMLGSNDMKPAIAGTALAAQQGMRRLAEIVKRHAPRIPNRAAPQLLIVAPPPLAETADPFFAAMFVERVAESRMLASMYADIAKEFGGGFFDAGTVATSSPIDGVHLDAENTRAIGEALVPVVRAMLSV